MKKLFYLLLFITLVGSLSAQTYSYNKETDKYVNIALSTPIKRFDVFEDKISNYIHYTLQYEEIKLDVYHELFKEYEQKDSWDFFCKNREGDVIMIYTPLDNLPQCRVSKETLNKIKNICLNYKKP